MNEQDILKYLDNELSDEERKTFEEKLRRDTELKQKLDEVRAKRRETLTAIDTLNPPVPVEVPDFETMQSAGKKQPLFSLHRLRAAAAILILAAASIAYFLIPQENTENRMTVDNNNITEIEETEYCSELDYYISPNRCWHKRELIYTYINKKNNNH
jgi:anti-sigma factor RsiW